MRDIVELIAFTLFILVFVLVFKFWDLLDPTAKANEVNGVKHVAASCLFHSDCVDLMRKECGVGNYTIISETASGPYDFEATCNTKAK